VGVEECGDAGPGVGLGKSGDAEPLQARALPRDERDARRRDAERRSQRRARRFGRASLDRRREYATRRRGVR
jgi:hypothetical protein